MDELIFEIITRKGILNVTVNTVSADNCGRENKDRFVLGCMDLLVARQIVKEVVVSFPIMVGHTHEGKESSLSCMY